MTDPPYGFCLRVAIELLSPGVPFDDATVGTPDKDRLVREIDQLGLPVEHRLDGFAGGDVGCDTHHTDDLAVITGQRRGTLLEPGHLTIGGASDAKFGSVLATLARD